MARSDPRSLGRCPQEIRLALAWAIFLAEGDCRASVPFGYLPLRGRSFWQVMQAVLRELDLEWARYQKAKAQGKLEEGADFVFWLARVGYNANPREWVDWERNVRHFLRYLLGSDRLE